MLDKAVDVLQKLEQTVSNITWKDLVIIVCLFIMSITGMAFYMGNLDYLFQEKLDTTNVYGCTLTLERDNHYLSVVARIDKTYSIKEDVVTLAFIYPDNNNIESDFKQQCCQLYQLREVIEHYKDGEQMVTRPVCQDEYLAGM